MRTVSGRLRSKYRRKYWTRQVVQCTMVRHDAQVDRVHTKNYPQEARERLGLAVIRAREAAGHQWRPSFAKAAGISVRSVVNVEKGEPVGPPVYEAVARALPNWDEDTPRVILEGGPAPAVGESPRAVARRVEHAALEIIQDPDKVGTDEWLEAADDLFEGDDLVAVLRIGLEARKRRREIQESLALVLRQTAERVRPSGVSDDRSRVD